MKKKLNILILPQFTNLSIPMRTQTAEIFGNFLSKNHKIVSIMKSKSHQEHFKWNDIEFNNLTGINFFKEIYKILTKKMKYDFVYLRDNFFLLCIAYLIKLRHKIPISIHQINSIKHLVFLYHKWYHPKALIGLIINTLHLKLLKKVDLVLPTSEWMGKYLVSQGINPKNIYNLPNGANFSLYDPFLSENQNQKFDYIYIGTMERVRNLIILIQAMKIVVSQLPDASLIMVGEGDDLTQLKESSIKLGIEKNIIFTGNLPYHEVPNFMSQSFVGISPIPPIYMYKVSSPLKIFEYWGSRLPVIANRGIPSHVKAIRESKGGILVDYTPESFASAMINLKMNRDKSTEMGNNGRKWVEENRTYEKLARDFEKKVLSLFKDT